MKRILIPLYLLLCLACCRTAPFVAPTLPQNPDYVADMEGNMDRAAGLFHSYEGVEGPQTPAPCGYKPFYVSHYGRHGSRRQIGSGGTEAYRILNEAAQTDNLTPEVKPCSRTWPNCTSPPWAWTENSPTAEGRSIKG